MTPTPEPLAALATRLDVAPSALAALRHCTATDLAAFDGLIGDAMTAHDQAIESGLRDALRFVPRLLRGRASAMLFPEDSHG